MTLIPTTSIPIETQRGDKSDYNIDGFATIRDVPVGIPWNIFTSFQRYLLD